MDFRNLNFRTGCLIAALCLIPAVSNASIALMESTFDSASLLATPVIRPPGQSISDPTVSISQCATCGFPGPALRTELSATSPDPYSLLYGVIIRSMYYDPQVSGPLGRIDLSIDKNLETSASGAIGASLSDASSLSFFRPLILQDGHYYYMSSQGQSIPLGNSGFRHFSIENVFATDFVEINFTTGFTTVAHPDFGGLGMSFGVLTRSLGNSLFDYRANITWDNYSVVDAPEPSSMALLAWLALGIGYVQRRNAKDR